MHMQPPCARSALPGVPVRPSLFMRYPLPQAFHDALPHHLKMPAPVPLTASAPPPRDARPCALHDGDAALAREARDACPSHLYCLPHRAPQRPPSPSRCPPPLHHRSPLPSNPLRASAPHSIRPFLLRCPCSTFPPHHHHPRPYHRPLHTRTDPPTRPGYSRIHALAQLLLVPLTSMTPPLCSSGALLSEFPARAGTTLVVHAPCPSPAPDDVAVTYAPAPRLCPYPPVYPPCRTPRPDIAYSQQTFICPGP